MSYFLGVAFLMDGSAEFSGEDRLILGLFFAGAVMCMGLSAFFHTVICHSKWACDTFSKFDYVGISVLILGSLVPWIYYSFYCDNIIRAIYMTLILVLGSASIFVSLWPKFGTVQYRSYRATIFSCFACSGVVPAIHFTISVGWTVASEQGALQWLLITGGLYGLGALLYACRIPERFCPGKFDIFFHSHQVFHFLVVVAAFTHFHVLVEMLMYRLTKGFCVAPHNLDDLLTSFEKSLNSSMLV